MINDHRIYKILEKEELVLYNTCMDNFRKEDLMKKKKETFVDQERGNAVFADLFHDEIAVCGGEYQWE